MLLHTRVATILAGLLWIAGCNNAPNPNNNSQLPGGYSESSNESEEVTAAAQFAIEEQSKAIPGLTLKSIESAKTQVVAGTNIELILNVIDAGQSKTARAIVYTDLSQTRSLSSWVWL